MESLQEFLELAREPTFSAVVLLLLLLVSVGTGWVNNRMPRAWFLVGLALAGVTLYIGLGRHEWGEVLFNGQLL